MRLIKATKQSRDDGIASLPSVARNDNIMFTIREILKAIDGKLMQGSINAYVNGVAIDSRAIEPNELFIAIKGENFDGHDFVRKVVARGVRVVVVHRPVKVSNRKVAVIRVEDTVKALGYLALFHRSRFDIPVIGITGSAGKTTTKEMIAAVLKTRLNVLSNVGTQNNHIGVPLTLLRLKKQHQAAVIEMGTNQPGDIPWLAKVARPTMAVLTNIGESHLEKLKNLAGIFQEKLTLAKAIGHDGCIIYNADDQYLKTIPHQKLSARLIAYSLRERSSNRATNVNIRHSDGLSFKVNKKSFFLKTFSVDMTYNALAAIACANILKISDKNVSQALKTFRFEKGRQEIFKKRGVWIINDSYNANPVSMRSAINALDAFPTDKRRIFICADMLELGRQSQRLHQEVGERVASSKIDVLMTLGDGARLIMRRAQCLRPQLVVLHFSHVEDLQHYVHVLCRENDVVLVKGSRRMKMENVVEFLMST